MYIGTHWTMRLGVQREFTAYREPPGWKTPQKVGDKLTPFLASGHHLCTAEWKEHTLNSSPAMQPHIACEEGMCVHSSQEKTKQQQQNPEMPFAIMLEMKK